MNKWTGDVQFDLDTRIGRVNERLARESVKVMGEGNWDVVGWGDMAETRNWYLVIEPGGETGGRLVCTCGWKGADGCEHALAVKIWRARNTQEAELQLEAMRAEAGVSDEMIETVPVKVMEVPYPDDEMWRGERWPTWVETFREHQWVAAQEIVQAFADGADVVILEAPTGSGKTLIAEMVRRMMDARGLYVCSDKTLQDQFAKDFGYAKVLKGRSNYPTLDGPRDVTCADCTKSRGVDGEWVCHWCDKVHACPYEVAKTAALNAELAVVNTSYLLAEANYIGKFSKRGLVVVDEADVLERELMGFVELFIGERQLARLARASGTGIELHIPAKGTRKNAVLEWLSGEYLPMVERAVLKIAKNETDPKRARERAAWQRAQEDAGRFVAEMKLALGRVEEGDGETGDWVRDNDAPGLAMKPVVVGEPATRLLWPHGKKWLLMSATVISADEMIGSLGIDRAGLDAVVVRVPMTFPVEHRPVRIVPAADMTARGKREGEWAYAINAMMKILADHPDDKVLVHCVSYELTRFMRDGVRERLRADGGSSGSSGSRGLFAYANAQERAGALASYLRSANGVLFAPSMDRGVDLPGDACRVVVIAKVPYPYIGDKQVSARMNRGREGQTWYAVQTIRSIVQMTGRGVRSAQDWAVSYVIDQQFGKLYGQNRRLFPKWWVEAVDTRVKAIAYRNYR